MFLETTTFRIDTGAELPSHTLTNFAISKDAKLLSPVGTKLLLRRVTEINLDARSLFPPLLIKTKERTIYLHVTEDQFIVTFPNLTRYLKSRQRALLPSATPVTSLLNHQDVDTNHNLNLVSLDLSKASLNLLFQPAFRRAHQLQPLDYLLAPDPVPSNTIFHESMSQIIRTPDFLSFQGLLFPIQELTQTPPNPDTRLYLPVLESDNSGDFNRTFIANGFAVRG